MTVIFSFEEHFCFCIEQKNSTAFPRSKISCNKLSLSADKEKEERKRTFYSTNAFLFSYRSFLTLLIKLAFNGFKNMTAKNS